MLKHAQTIHMSSFFLEEALRFTLVSPCRGIETSAENTTKAEAAANGMGTRNANSNISANSMDMRGSNS